MLLVIVVGLSIVIVVISNNVYNTPKWIIICLPIVVKALLIVGFLVIITTANWVNSNYG